MNPRILATRGRTLLLLLFAVSGTGSAVAGESNNPLASGIIDANAPRHVRIEGSDAIAGFGDWYLSNGHLCAAILSADHEGQLVVSGGSLVDVGHCGRSDDQFIGLEPMFNLSRAQQLPVSIVRAESGDDSARIIAIAYDEGLELTTEFVLDLEDPNRLLIHSRLTRTGPGPRFFSHSEILIHTKSALRNFILNAERPHEGFRHISLEESSWLEIGRAIRTAKGVVIMGSDVQGPPISYLYRPLRAEWNDAYGRSVPLDHLSLGMESVTVTNVMSNPFWLPNKSLGPLEALQGLFMDLGLGESVVYEREIRLSKRADIASLSDEIFADPLIPVASVAIRGRVDAPGARLHFEASASPDRGEFHEPFTMARTDAEGRFSLQLPPGRYRIRALADGNRSASHSFDVPNGSPPIDIGQIELSSGGTIVLPRGDTMRLVFRGIADTKDPVFGRDYSQLTINGQHEPTSLETGDVHLAGIDADPKSIEIAPGHYAVYATRGPEFSVTQTSIQVGERVPAVLRISPPVRVLETPGWIAADFHVHSALSFDSTLPQRQRLISFAAEGGEVLVATDHDVVSDYSALIVEMGLRERLGTLSGIEITSISPTAENPDTTGHINMYPVSYRPDENRNGAMPNEGRRLRRLISEARALRSDTLVQLNHPRNLSTPLDHGAFFEHLSVAGAPFDPSIPVSEAPNHFLLQEDPESGVRDIDFDAIELYNGKRIETYRAVREDWFSLLRQGYRSTGTANSDTHRLGAVVSVPRNYVRMANDAVAQFSPEPFIESTRRGALCGTTGPILNASLEGAGPGDTHRGRSGELRIEIKLAPWISLSTLRIYRNGDLYKEIPIGGATVSKVPIEFSSDAFVVVEVEGPAEGLYAIVLPGFTPLAYCNPIYVDADADGRWTPPGLSQ